MRKLLFIILLSTSLLIAACASESSAFQSQIKEAQDHLNDMEYEEAIQIYSDLEENVLPGDRYETGRMEVVAKLKENAEYMSEHIHELTESYNASLALYEQAIASEDTELYREAIRSLDDTIERMGDMTELDMYEELVAARDDLSASIEELLASITGNLDDSLEALDFPAAESYFQEINTLHQAFPDLVSESTVTQYEDKLEKEKERFVYVPESAYDWQEAIHENEDGSIQFKGIRNDENGIELIISYQDYYKPLHDKINLDPELILANGDTASGTLEETRVFEEETLEIYSYSTYEDTSLDDIVRVNVELPFVQEEPIQVAFDGIDESEIYEVPGIESIKAQHQSDWTLESDTHTIEVDQFSVDDYEIVITGNIQPSKDMMVEEFSYAYLPTSEQTSTRGTKLFGGTHELELYEGTEKEFELNYSFSQPITEYDEYVSLYLYHEHVLVDLKTGEIYEKEDPTFLGDIHQNVSRTYDRFDDSEQKELINQDRDRVTNDSILLQDGASTVYFIGNQFETLTATIDVHEDYHGADYGTTELVIYSIGEDDEEEIFSTTVEENHSSSEIEIDVSDVNSIRITTAADYGPEGTQKIILTEPMLK